MKRIFFAILLLNSIITTTHASFADTFNGLALITLGYALAKVDTKSQIPNGVCALAKTGVVAVTKLTQYGYEKIFDHTAEEKPEIESNYGDRDDSNPYRPAESSCDSEKSNSQVKIVQL